MIASSPGSVRARTEAATASDTPHVIVTSVSGSAEIPLKASDERLSEYACHEGNSETAARSAGSPHVHPY